MVRTSRRRPGRGARVRLASAAAAALACCFGGDQRGLLEPCDTDDQCAEALVCAYGRCRPLCSFDADCPAGALCVIASDGRRFCAFGDDGCNCDLGLLCVAGECLPTTSAGDGDADADQPGVDADADPDADVVADADADPEPDLEADADPEPCTPGCGGHPSTDCSVFTDAIDCESVPGCALATAACLDADGSGVACVGPESACLRCGCNYYMYFCGSFGDGPYCGSLARADCEICGCTWGEGCSGQLTCAVVPERSTCEAAGCTWTSCP
jgi:hypothetical protein